MSERIVCLTDREASLATQGKLAVLVRVMRKHVHTVYQSPFGQPGDVLAAKETWCEIRDLLFWGERLQSAPEGYGAIAYKCDGEIRQHGVTLKAPEEFNTTALSREDEIKWRSPVTMPAWAIRHRFTVKSVRVMQAKDVTPGVLLGTIDYDWETFYKRYGDEKTWVWYCELEDMP